jgi:hypothetical protein
MGLVTISVLIVGSYYRNNRLSFKGFLKFPEMFKRDLNLVDKRVVLFSYYENMVQWAGSFVNCYQHNFAAQEYS